MAFFAQESLDQLRQRVDLVDLVSSLIDLKRAGTSYKACCPFHDEKSPSFNINKGAQHYHCFGCGAHGDAIRFLMEYQQMGFQDAVEHLAARYNVVLQEVEKGESKGPPKKVLRQALSCAGDLFHFLLLHTQEGHQALKYLYDRGITLDFIKTFKIGLAAQDTQPFFAYMKAQDVPEFALRESGLLKEARDGRWRAFFRERITFPICDAAGSVIGFSARKYKEDTFGGKYVNTPETPLFKKSRVLFGLHHCRRRIAKEKQALIVEGQIDALRLIHNGLNITVAGQGTAFGEGHVKELLSLGVQRIYLALDADAAGREATLKIGHLFQKSGVEVRVVPIPLGDDPDSLLMNRGPEHFLELMDKSADYLHFIVHYLGQGVDMNSPAAKSELVGRVVQRIRDWNNELMVHESLKQLAKLVKVPESMVGVGQSSAPNLYIKKIERAGLTQVDPDRVLESDLLRWLLMASDEKMRALVQRNVSREDFRDALCGELFTMISKAGAEASPLSLAADAENPEIQGLISEIMDRYINLEKADEGVREVIKRLLERNWMLAREQVREKIHQSDGSVEEQMELVKEFDRLRAAAPELQEVDV